MANNVPVSLPVPDVGLLLAGQSLDSQSIEPLGQAVNWLAAHLGSATPRILQLYPAEGTSRPGTSICRYTSLAQQQVSEWRIPATRGASSVECYLYCVSTSSTSTVRWDSVTQGDSVTTFLSTSWTLIQATLDIDTAAGYETIRMYLDAGAAPATIQVGAVMVMVDPATSLPSTSWVVPFDEDELAVNQSLNAEQGVRICNDLATMRVEAPHVYWSWSSFAHEATTHPESRYMVAWPHCMTALVWADTQREEWNLTIHARVQQGTYDQTLTIHAHVGASGPYQRSVTLQVPAGASEIWVTGSIRLPNHRRVARNMPAGWETIMLIIWPEPSAADAVSEWTQLQGEPPSALSSRSLMSLCVWGA